MFIFADAAAYGDILLQRDENPEFSELVLKKITDEKDALDQMKALDPEEPIIVFLNAKGYKGSNITVAAKIATEYGLL